MPDRPTVTVEREGRRAIVHLHGDIAVPTAKTVYGQLRSVGRRRDVREVVIDFSGVKHLDSAGVAVVSLAGKQLKRAGKRLEMEQLDERQQAAFELFAHPAKEAEPIEPSPGFLERVGDRTYFVGSSAKVLGQLLAEAGRQLLAVTFGGKSLPAGALSTQIVLMGVGGVFIVSLLSFLLGMTMAFQGAVQLQRFGAGVFVADMISMSMVRELAPLMTAVILTGRTGAAIAAELGTMKVRSEIDALHSMGINPVRFLLLPRLLGITIAGPALTLIGTFVGIFGGMVVATLTLDMPAVTFWSRIVERLSLGDFVHGLSKSLVFAWIIGFTGCHLGMRTGGDATSVGAATTRTVVVSIFFIILVDAIFATISTYTRYA